LKWQGKLYHYIPQTGITKAKQNKIDIAKRLKNAGFKDIKHSKEAQGLIIYKS